MIRHQFTIKGKGPRRYMQDAGKRRSLIKKQAAWFILCDGMGGQPGGAEAATICSATLDRFLFETIRSGTNFPATTLIQRGMIEVAEQLQLHILENMSHLMMGTTICGLFQYKDELIAFWTGDSRIFQFRNSRCVWRSLPHTPVFDDYRAGKISLATAEKRKTNILTKYIEGSSCFPFIEIQPLKAKNNDDFLLCTDGVWNAFEITSLAGFFYDFHKSGKTDQFKKQLTKLANDNYFVFAVSC